MIYLSAREYELTEHITAGLTINMAARRMHVGYDTAKNAARIIYCKCGFPLGSGPQRQLIEMFRTGQIKLQLGQGKAPESRPGEHPYRVEPRRTKLTADERRWNAVWEQKYSDPDYYAHGPEIRCRSALADF